MVRSILAGALAVVLGATVVQARSPGKGIGRERNPQQWEKCNETARDRGFSGGKTHGARRNFMQACMHGRMS
jgi:hypothetical protein